MFGAELHRDGRVWHMCEKQQEMVAKERRAKFTPVQKMHTQEHTHKHTARAHFKATKPSFRPRSKPNHTMRIQ